MRVADRAGTGGDVRVGDVLALEGDHRPRPVLLDAGEVLVGDPAAGRVVDAERRVFLPRPPEAHAEHQPPAAEPVQIRGHAGGLQGVAVREDHDRRAQLDGAGPAREPGQRGERVVERRRKGARDLRGQRHMVGDHRQVVAQLLGAAHPRLDAFGGGALPVVEDVDADLHSRSPRLLHPSSPGSKRPGQRGGCEGERNSRRRWGRGREAINRYKGKGVVPEWAVRAAAGRGVRRAARARRPERARTTPPRGRSARRS